MGIAHTFHNTQMISHLALESPLSEEEIFRLSELVQSHADLLAAARECVEVLTEPGIMDVDEWKAWQRRTVNNTRQVIARATKETP